MATSRSDAAPMDRVFAQGRPVRAGPDREPRRDRPADHPGLSRDGHGGDRRLQRRRRPCPARPGRRSRGPDRPGAGDRELSAGRRHRRGGACHRRPGGPSGLRLPRRARVVRRGGRGRRDGLRRARTTGRSPRSATSWRRDGRRPSVGVPVVPGTLEPAPVDRPDQVASIVAAAERGRVPAPGQGRRRRRRPGDAPGHQRRRAAGGARVGLARGGLRLRRRLGLPRAGDPAGPPHRGPAARATPTVGSSPSASATARSSGATRSSSRRRPPRA